MSVPDPPGRARLHGWRDPSVLGAALLAFSAGFAQFAASTALPDVAAAFGDVAGRSGVAAQLGLTATTIGLGTALIRVSSLTGLPLAAAADRLGRRRVVLATSAIGLAFAATAALSPGFWVFVALCAVGRGPLSATNAISGVIAAEETPTKHRAKAIALITGSYGAGAGLTGIIRALGGDGFGFRPLFALVLVPLLLLPLIGRMLHEPDRFVAVDRQRRSRQARRAGDRVATPLRSRLGLDPFAGRLRRRFVAVTGAAFTLALISGPVNTNMFIYTELVIGQSRTTTALALAASGPLGLAGLLLGRVAADRIGRRVTAATCQVLVAVAGAVAYSGSLPALFVGYMSGIFFASVFAPSGGALAMELFPTRVRGTVAGWVTIAGVIGATVGLLAFGTLVDGLGYAGASRTLAVPVALCAGLYLLVPETKTWELEDAGDVDTQPADPSPPA